MVSHPQNVLSLLLSKGAWRLLAPFSAGFCSMVTWVFGRLGIVWDATFIGQKRGSYLGFVQIGREIIDWQKTSPPNAGGAQPVSKGVRIPTSHLQVPSDNIE